MFVQYFTMKNWEACNGKWGHFVNYLSPRRTCKIGPCSCHLYVRIRKRSTENRISVTMYSSAITHWLLSCETSRYKKIKKYKK